MFIDTLVFQNKKCPKFPVMINSGYCRSVCQYRSYVNHSPGESIVECLSEEEFTYELSKEE